MTGIRNPNDIRKAGGKILMPGQSPGTDDIAAQRARAEMAMENHPFFKMIKEQEDAIRGLTIHNRMVNTRFNALVDYLHDMGLLLSQPLNQETGLVDDTVTPSTPKDSALFYDGLIEANLIETPKFGLERYIEEHMHHDQFMATINQALEAETSMLDVLVSVREFNDNERRLRKMNANQFPLAEWLTLNPEALTTEDLDAIAAEFGLKKNEEVVVPEEIEPPVDTPEIAQPEEQPEPDEEPKLKLVE